MKSKYIYTCLKVTALPVILLFSASMYGCDTTEIGSVSSQDRSSQPYMSTRATIVKDSLVTELLGQDEIVGIATINTAAGNVEILVFTKTSVETWNPQKKSIIPREAGGYSVRPVTSGEIIAPRSAGTTSATQEYDRPIPIGVSGGAGNGSTGTLGARVSNSESVFVLSNTHVFTLFSNTGIGDPIIQPGSIDGGDTQSDVIGFLTDFATIDFSGECVNDIDAAIAVTNVDSMSVSTPASGYGIPYNETGQPHQGMEVQKYGRTSGLTYGSVVSTNATVEVSYGNLGIACFTDQIIITPGEFSTGGDSGSLVVTSSSNPNESQIPVGLVFAGSPSISVANKIDNVLSRFNVVMDGTDSRSHSQNGSSDGNLNGQDEDGDNYDASPQHTHELLIKVVDTNGSYEEGKEVCAFDGPNSSECDESASGGVDGPGYNWVAEMEGTCGACGPVIDLHNDTDYILRQVGASNSIYFHRELGQSDAEAKLTINSSGGNSFSYIGDDGWTAFAVVEAQVSNIGIPSYPRYVGTAQEITWDVDWDGHANAPSFFPQNAEIILIDDSSTETTLTTTGNQDYGSGSYYWTPTQEYQSAKIKIIDNDSGDSVTSSSFSIIEPPVSVTINGPILRDVNQSGTWTATVAGGEQPYTYDWDYYYICGPLSIAPQLEDCGTWFNGGTGASWSHTVLSDDYDMKIRLTVTDDDSPSSQDTDYHTVDIGEL